MFSLTSEFFRFLEAQTLKKVSAIGPQGTCRSSSWSSGLGCRQLSRCVSPDQGLCGADDDNSGDPFQHILNVHVDHVFSDCLGFLKAI